MDACRAFSALLMERRSVGESVHTHHFLRFFSDGRDPGRGDGSCGDGGGGEIYYLNGAWVGNCGKFIKMRQRSATLLALKAMTERLKLASNLKNLLHKNKSKL